MLQEKILTTAGIRSNFQNYKFYVFFPSFPSFNIKLILLLYPVMKNKNCQIFLSVRLNKIDFIQSSTTERYISLSLLGC